MTYLSLGHSQFPSEVLVHPVSVLHLVHLEYASFLAMLLSHIKHLFMLEQDWQCFILESQARQVPCVLEADIKNPSLQAVHFDLVHSLQ